MWAIAMRHARFGEVDAAMRQVARMERLGPLRPGEEAFKATLLIRQLKPAEANALLAKVAKETNGDRKPNGIYVNLFARQLLAEQQGDAAKAILLANEIMKIPCHPRLHRWLPPSQPNNFDRWFPRDDLG